jgi:hypothetical protein
VTPQRQIVHEGYQTKARTKQYPLMPRVSFAGLGRMKYHVKDESWDHSSTARFGRGSVEYLTTRTTIDALLIRYRPKKDSQRIRDTFGATLDLISHSRTRRCVDVPMMYSLLTRPTNTMFNICRTKLLVAANLPYVTQQIIPPNSPRIHTSSHLHASSQATSRLGGLDHGFSLAHPAGML